MGWATTACLCAMKVREGRTGSGAWLSSGYGAHGGYAEEGKETGLGRHARAKQSPRPGDYQREGEAVGLGMLGTLAHGLFAWGLCRRGW